MGYDKLYLVTDHMGFYERCGWKFLTMAKDQEAMPIRLYEADTREIEKIRKGKVGGILKKISTHLFTVLTICVILALAQGDRPAQFRYREV